MDDVGDRVVSQKGRRGWLERAALVLVVGALAVAQSCATATSHSSPAPDRRARTEPASGPVPDGSGSAELARKVLAGLEAKDERALASLVVAKDEFCSRVFPELPSSKAPNVSCDFVWDMAMLNHDAGFQHVYGRYTKKGYSFVSLRFEGGAKTYPSFKVHKGPLVTVKNAGGEQQELRLFGDVLEIDGQFKLFGFMVD